jgi:hypothetical protein
MEELRFKIRFSNNDERVTRFLCFIKPIFGRSERNNTHSKVNPYIGQTESEDSKSQKSGIGHKGKDQGTRNNH